MEIKFTANDLGKPPVYGPIASVTQKKVADCELIFKDGPLTGHKLQGFVIWRRVKTTGTHKIGEFSVSGPNFQYRTLGGLRSCGLLRSVDDDSYGYGEVQNPLRQMILEAYKKWAKSKRGRVRKFLDKVITK